MGGCTYAAFRPVSWPSRTSPHNPMGVKGIGEGGTTGSAPAVANAVLAAPRPLGIRQLDMPLTPFRIWEAIRQAEETPHPALPARGEGKPSSAEGLRSFP